MSTGVRTLAAGAKGPVGNQPPRLDAELRGVARCPFCSIASPQLPRVWADDLDRLCTKRKLSVADTRLIKFMIGEIGLEEFNAS
jgi:hypothetical protein